MATKRVPAEVQTAMELAKAAGWPVSIRNGKIVITASDGTALTVGLDPNEESLKVFRSNCRRYNLIGEGPARTPKEQEALVREAEQAGLTEAEKKNRKRQAYEAEQARKRAEAEEAKRKAEAAIAKGLAAPKPVAEAPKPKVTPAVPKAVVEPKRRSVAAPANGFPVFDPKLVGTTDYPKFELPDGTYYCIECWQGGVQFTARKPQGLATHRGFRHQMYQGEGVSAPANQGAAPQEVSAMKLPGEIRDALDLLGNVIADHVGNGEDSARVAELEKALQEVKEQAAKDLERADQQYSELKAATDKALEAQKKRVHELSQELHGKDGIHESETKALLASFQALLTQIREAINNLSPAQAVGKIDGLLAEYLGS